MYALACFHLLCLCRVKYVPTKSQCLSSKFLNVFNIPVDTVLDGKLFQLFITLLVTKSVHKDYYELCFSVTCKGDPWLQMLHSV